MQIQHYILKNGLKVVLADTQAFPSLTTLLLVGAGSRYENKTNNGIAHFFEHMAFKGSKKYPSAMHISTLLDSLGSEQNAFTSKDHTGYWIKAPAKHFKTVLNVLSDMIQNSLLKNEEIEREKGVIIEEINMYEDQPQAKVWNLFEDLLYKNNALGMDIIGTKSAVNSFSRQTFLDYTASLYKPNNIVLVVAGGFNSCAMTKFKIQISQNLEHWVKGDTLNFEPVKEIQTKPAILVHAKKTEQAHFILGHRAFSRNSKKRYIQNLLTIILGGGMSSRLFYELRERRGLCYYIQTSSEMYSDVGYLYTRAGVSTEKAKIQQAVSLILKEYKKIVKGELKEDELVKAKEMLKGRTTLSLENSHNLALFYGRKLLLEGQLKTLQEVFKQIDFVTKEQVINLAKELFVEKNINIALVSPNKSIRLLN